MVIFSYLFSAPWCPLWLNLFSNFIPESRLLPVHISNRKGRDRRFRPGFLDLFISLQDFTGFRVKLIDEMNSDDDRSLAKAAHLEPQAFALLYDRYLDRIYAYALRQAGDVSLAQDVTSATFEKALRSLRQREWRGQSFLAWLYRIARNEAIAHHRQGRRIAEMPPDLPAADNQEDGLLADQERQQLVCALSRLSPRDQEVLGLRFLEGLSSAEAAEVLGCSLPNLYLQAHRALRRLRKLIVELEDAPGV
jgi:RNA polymerase sigma-70 factor (ECF subfamily)